MISIAKCCFLLKTRSTVENNTKQGYLPASHISSPNTHFPVQIFLLVLKLGMWYFAFYCICGKTTMY